MFRWAFGGKNFKRCFFVLSPLLVLVKVPAFSVVKWFAHHVLDEQVETMLRHGARQTIVRAKSHWTPSARTANTDNCANFWKRKNPPYEVSRSFETKKLPTKKYKTTILILQFLETNLKIFQYVCDSNSTSRNSLAHDNFDHFPQFLSIDGMLVFKKVLKVSCEIKNNLVGLQRLSHMSA